MSLTDDTTELESGALVENNKTHAHNIVKTLYSDVATPHPDVDLVYKYGAITAAGYFALGGGDTKIINFVDRCEAANNDKTFANGVKCAVSGAAAVGAHVFAFLAGAAYGTGSIAYIAGVARQVTGAGGLNPGNDQNPGKRDLLEISGRASCPTAFPITTDSYWPGGTAGVKLSAEIDCTQFSQDEATIMSILTGQVAQGMVDGNAWQAQVTYYTNRNNKNVVL
ncbi:uncharacterized protein LTR77_002500 [Saxophila tyrrhenica]|uniref:Uncharacterized protein n=1 Tax=Saxophila tyrrhenica TaxID=1690608 RepID=A0AAV9PIS8_9PEZI|nr:hypothetical protein LTR77_002500 [Saxophila tyrrhenica]